MYDTITLADLKH